MSAGILEATDPLAFHSNDQYGASRNALVAQLDRASDFDSEGREFESLRVRQFTQTLSLNKSRNRVVQAC
jgi:hypothetical protein